jgi:chemotaxis response regulator CheB
MPSSAISTGAVDYVLPLHDIAAAIERIVNGQPVDALAIEPR